MLLINNTSGKFQFSALLGGPSGTPRRLPQATQPQAPLQGECTPSWKVRRVHVGISSELKVLKVPRVGQHLRCSLSVPSPFRNMYATKSPVTVGVHSPLPRDCIPNLNGAVAFRPATCARSLFIWSFLGGFRDRLRFVRLASERRRRRSLAAPSRRVLSNHARGRCACDILRITTRAIMLAACCCNSPGFAASRRRTSTSRSGGTSRSGI